MKRKFIINLIPNAGEPEYRVSGPFVVVARHPAHAARLVRHKWPSYLGNHICQETNALSVREWDDPARAAYVSDRRGQWLPSSRRFAPVEVAL
jgi:hypothetical protein